MLLSPQVSIWLLQAAALPDTIVTKTMPAERGVFDYTSGTLQIIVLLLAVVVLVALAVMLVALKRGLEALRNTVDKLYVDTRPLVVQATQVAEDAREVVAMLRTDVERVTEAAGELSNQLLDAAAVTERRMDDVNAVLDVVQEELEETALSATAALRGVRVGGKALAAVFGNGGSSKRSQRRERELRERELREREHREREHRERERGERGERGERALHERERAERERRRRSAPD